MVLRCARASRAGAPLKLLDCASEITRAAVTVVHGLPPIGTILRMSRALSAAKQLFLLCVTQLYPLVWYSPR